LISQTQTQTQNEDEEERRRMLQGLLRAKVFLNDTAQLPELAIAIVIASAFLISLHSLLLSTHTPCAALG